MPCLLLSYAHPDDESFLAAGTVCRYALEGVPSVLVTATLGQAGKCGDPPICTRDELPRVREQELRRACRLLGIADLHLLRYQDRHLGEVPHQEIRSRLSALIRRYRPEVVATFDPQGLNLHADHIAISRFTSDAVAAAADPRFEPGLGLPHRIQRLLWTPPLAVWDLEAQGPWEGRPGVDFLIDARRFSERKRQALQCHATQLHSIRRYFLDRPNLEEILSVELFRQAWGPPLAKRPSRDLFEGLR